MIVVSVGTHEQPFDRLIRAAADLDVGEPVVVQYGSSKLPHGPGEWFDYLSFDELADYAREARVFVCHAGVGSIVLARRFGHRPVVVPRRHHLGEHVDDHQLSLASRLGRAGVVTVLEDTGELGAVVREVNDAARTTGAGDGLPGPDVLGGAVRSVLADLGTAPLARHAA
jgi:UDP-N-acetylglucosamine transferase subunit ALG13